MKTSNTGIGLVCLLVVGLTAGHAAAQGGLTPPGAPSPTMKTLEQIEPRIDAMTLAGDASSEIVIAEPGSYYLSANLEVAKTYGINITATDVVLDLNGFNISRASGSGGYGVYMGGERTTVCNGTIVGFNYGTATYSEGGLFERLAVSGCASWGILGGTSSRVIDCRTHDNSGSGISAGTGSSLSGCVANNNQNIGIGAGSGSSLSGCTANDNQGTGINVGFWTSLIGCTANLNDGTYGIFAGTGASLNGCTACNNQGTGIHADSDSSLSGCTANSNDGTSGIHAGTGASLSGCIANNNQGSGIDVGAGSNLDGCTVDGNQGNGIHANNGSTLTGCAARNNQGTYGIYASYGSSLTGCAARNNQVSYGIFVDSGSSLNGCLACYNTGTGSSSFGIYAGFGTMVAGCTVRQNSNTNSPGTSSQGGGIIVGDSGTVRDCTVSYNEGDGIRISCYSVVTGNSCDNNGRFSDGAGIHDGLGCNRIEGNNVTYNYRGIAVGTGGSLIVRNSASGNSTDYYIFGTQTIGPIISATGTISNSNPWANFSY